MGADGLSLKFRCHCGKRYTVGLRRVGRSVTCARCGASVKVPRPHQDRALALVCTCGESTPANRDACQACGKPFPRRAATHKVRRGAPDEARAARIQAVGYVHIADRDDGADGAQGGAEADGQSEAGIALVPRAADDRAARSASLARVRSSESSGGDRLDAGALAGPPGGTSAESLGVARLDTGVLASPPRDSSPESPSGVRLDANVLAEPGSDTTAGASASVSAPDAAGTVRLDDAGTRDDPSGDALAARETLAGATATPGARPAYPDDAPTVTAAGAGITPDELRAAAADDGEASVAGTPGHVAVLLEPGGLTPSEAGSSHRGFVIGVIASWIVAGTVALVLLSGHAATPRPPGASPGAPAIAPESVRRPEGAFFERYVQPVLARHCASGACHGGSAGGRLALVELSSLPEAARHEAALRNRREALRFVTPDRPGTSPLLTKALKLDAGGQEHRGGNRWETTTTEAVILATWIRGVPAAALDPRAAASFAAALAGYPGARRASGAGATAPPPPREMVAALVRQRLATAGVTSASTPRINRLIADAGLDRSGQVSVPVRLDGRGSRAADRRSALRFTWRLSRVPRGSRATLTGAQTARPEFTPDVPGLYLARLEVAGATGRAHDFVAVSVGPFGAHLTLEAEWSADANGFVALADPAAGGRRALALPATAGAPARLRLALAIGQAGWYTFWLRYRTRDSREALRTVSLALDGGPGMPLILPATPSFALARLDRYRLRARSALDLLFPEGRPQSGAETRGVIARLDPGLHTLAVSLPPGGVVLDSVTVLPRATTAEPSGVAPAIAPETWRRVRRRFLDFLERGPTPLELALAARLPDDALVRELLGRQAFADVWRRDVFSWLGLPPDTDAPGADADPAAAAADALAGLPAELAAGLLTIPEATARIVSSPAFVSAYATPAATARAVLGKLLGLDPQAAEHRGLVLKGTLMIAGREATLFGTPGASRADFVAICLRQPAFYRRMLARTAGRLLCAPAERELAAAASAFATDPLRGFAAPLVRWYLRALPAASLGARRRTMTDGQYLRALWVDCLGTAPTPAEYAALRAAAVPGAGLDRSAIARALVEGPWARIKNPAASETDAWIVALYARLLGRAPNAAERTAARESLALPEPQSQPSAGRQAGAQALWAKLLASPAYARY